MRLGLSLLAPLLAVAAAHAADLPQPASVAAPLPQPADRAWPGVITLSVDATDLAHGVFAVDERIPVGRPGPLTLLYPEWVPGNHSPTGPIARLAGLSFSAGGKPLAWRRDPVDMYAFHLDVPAGATSLEAKFQYLSPVDEAEGRVEMTPDMLNLSWNTTVLYPAGVFSRDIAIAPSVRLPPGFRFATALGAGTAEADRVRFPVTPLNRLVDSPVLAGRFFESLDLDPGGPVPVRLDVVADRPDELAINPSELAAHRALVAQAVRLFGAHHYDHYDFLLWLSDRMGGQGLEHHQSSQDGSIPKYFTDWDAAVGERDLLPHEYTHSWNGKYRRPADLWTANFNTPMRDSLLWVYEGQTQYWGKVLAARSGLVSRDQALADLAWTAAAFANRPGRAWRDLADTTNAPIIALRRPQPWLSWQRGEDYYSEGELLWLDVDTLIRQRSGGARSLDDFARAFFGAPSTGPITRTYTFADLVAALDAVEPYDWAGFLQGRLHADAAPLAGVTRGGYRLAFAETRTPYQKAVEGQSGDRDFSYSVGFSVDKAGTLDSVLWGGPAFQAGLRLGATIMAVDGEDYDAEALEAAITRAKTDPAPIRLIVKEEGRWRAVDIPWHGGLRYPRLEPIPGAPRLLDAILAAKP